MKTKLTPLIVLLVLALPGAALHAQQTTWVHLLVQEEGETQVELNLPISMVTVALEAIRSEAMAEANAAGASEDLPLDEARRMWQAMRDAGDAEFLNMQDGDETMRVFREGDRVFVHGSDGENETLRIEMPVEVADAVLAEAGGEIDVEGAIRELVSRGESELLLIRDDEATVRLWADGRSTQD